MAKNTKTDQQLLTEAQERITELEGQLDISEEKALKLEGGLTTANEKADRLEGELKTANEKAAKFEGELKTSTDKVTKLEGEKKTVDEAADVKAREIAARSGGNLAAKDPKAGNSLIGGNDNKTMARADFDLLPAKDQRAFCMGGGKLTN
jgi:chromosome segregation ATPase